MTTGPWLLVAGLANVVLILGLALAAALLRLRRDRRERRREDELAQLRPVLLRYLAGWEDGDARDLLDELIAHRATEAGFEELVAGLLPKLRGADRSALVDILRRRGSIEAACVQTGYRRAGLRGTAAELLGAAGAVEGIPFVIPLLADRDPQVRLAAVRALGRIGTPASAVALLDHLDRADSLIPSHPVTMALLRIGTDASEPLMAALRADRASVQAMAAEVLGVLGVIAAAGPLERRLGADPDASVRLGAAHALGRLGLPGSVAGLVEIMETEGDTAVIAAACTSLGAIADPASGPALAWALSDDEPAVRVAAATALAALGETGNRILKAAAQLNAQGADAAREALAAAAVATDADRRSRA